MTELSTATDTTMAAPRPFPQLPPSAVRRTSHSPASALARRFLPASILTDQPGTRRMNDRIEIYHRPFDPYFARLSFTERDRRAIDALNLQTARKFRTRTGDPFPEDPDGIDPQVLAWRSAGFATLQLSPDNTLDVREHALDCIDRHDDPASSPDPVLDDSDFHVLGLALDHAMERDALRKIELLKPEPGTQLRHMFYTTPSVKRLHFDYIHDPELPEDLQRLPGHWVNVGADNILYLDWMDLEAVLMNLSMHCSLGHIAHWDPTEDDPPETRRALVTWLWNGDPSQWTRTVRLVPATCSP